MKHYRELIVWQKAMDLVKSVYETTSCFPSSELYGLTSQVRRAAVSIPSNIAEGQGRNTTRDFLHFLSVAQGSLREVETQISIAESLGYIEKQLERTILDTTAEVGRLISGLCNSLKNKLH
ncbi:MAG: four helix bundle protein [Pirellulales bacterium]|nr:four helix bundle protein [Pirellulales bacterium]